MKKASKVLGIILVVIVIVSACCVAGGYAEKHYNILENYLPFLNDGDLKLPGETEKREITVEEIETKLVEIGQLSTYSGEYTVEQENEFTRHFLDNIRIPGTTNSIHITCTGIVKVGYDIKEVNPKVDNDSHKIYIALPAPKVLDNYIIWDSVKCQETNNILNPIDFEQYQSIIDDLENHGLKDAEEHGIYQAAEENAKLVIQNFLSCFDTYEVVFIK